MRLTIAFLILAVSAFGVVTPKRVPPDEAAKHLVNKVPPTYPPLAEAARIQGNVILEVQIDESGATSVRRLVSGHPMLAPAAIVSANRWRYQPFHADGKPSAVVTVVMVTFGNPGKEHDADAREEMLFQSNFWSALESAQAALQQKDYTSAEQQLNKAKDVLAKISNSLNHQSEQWQVLITTGRLASAQSKNAEAEQCYKKALELREKDDKDAPEMAVTLADMGKLYADEKRYDLARDYATRSVAIYQKNLKRVGSGASGARDVYGRAIAYQSWMLSRIALQQNNKVEADKECREVLEFQSFLIAEDRDSLVSSCTQKGPSSR